MIATLAAALSSGALSFAPPLDQPLRYETTERRPRPDGSVFSATLTQDVVFAADDGGYLMTIRTTGYRTTLPPAQGGTFDTVMRSMVGNVVRVHVSIGGVPERVIDGAASWAAMLTAMRVVIAARPPGDATMAPAAMMLASLGATTPAERDARLIAGAGDVLGTRLPPLAIGAQAKEEGGTVARTADTGDEARYHERTTRTASGRSLETDGTVAVSRVTGLVTHSLRRTAVSGPSLSLLLSESETRLASR